ncbi:MAG TPA: hypothetical protein DCK99_13215 [Blastocatellia bacterium]|jgi:hypothetical protein|nr:hypothetical protein [Blastocatellia bacterium]
MKSIMRRKLAQENFAEKIRKVSELIQLSAKLKAVRTDARNLARTSPSAVDQASSKTSSDVGCDGALAPLDVDHLGGSSQSQFIK